MVGLRSSRALSAATLLLGAAVVLGVAGVSASLDAAELFDGFDGAASEDAWVPSEGDAYNGVADLDEGTLTLPEEARRYVLSTLSVSLSPTLSPCILSKK